MAEGEGFEPSVACATSVFKTGALNQTLPPLRVGRTLRNKVVFGKQQTLKSYFLIQFRLLNRLERLIHVV